MITWQLRRQPNGKWLVGWERGGDSEKVDVSDFWQAMNLLLKWRHRYPS